MALESKFSLLMNSFNEFYIDHKEYILEIKNIVDQNNILSLRILDWFITNYSKKFHIIINDNFNVYQSYKLMLKSFSKRYFDPFCRKNKIKFFFPESETDFIETSCGQLCFFKWCFENNILDFVKKNLTIIEDDMKNSLKQKATEVKETASEIKRRQPLSVSASRTVTKRHVKYLIEFN